MQIAFRSRTVTVIGICVLVILGTILHQSRPFVAAQGSRLQYGETVEGTISGTNARDAWQFEGLEGDVVSVHLEAATENFIPTVTLRDPHDTLLIDTVAPESANAAVEFTTELQRSGKYSIQISGANSSNGTYTLTLTLVASATVLPSGTGAITYGHTVKGEISDGTFRQFWVFRGGREDIVDIRMHATNGDLDAFLTLLNPNGEELATSSTGEAGLDAGLFAVRLPVSGTYTVVARRAGAGFGEQGTTHGTYDLSLVLRQAGAFGDDITPADLTLGDQIRGQLSADAPNALFRVRATGVLALEIELTDPDQVGNVTIMTPERAPLSVISGLSPIRTSVSIVEQREVWIEVGTTGLRETSPVDFSLTPYQLVAAKQTAQPLVYGVPRASSKANPTTNNWYFVGHSGDVIELSILPFERSENGTISVTTPSGDTILIASTGSAVNQSLVLSENGPYEITVAEINSGYEIGVARNGYHGYSFDQIAVTQVHSQLAPTEIASDTLGPGQADQWFFDIRESHTWRFALTHMGSNTPLGLEISHPDGSQILTALSDTLSSTALAQVTFPEPGLYSIVVFEPTFELENSYTLVGLPVDGGRLENQTTRKGALTPTVTTNYWNIDVAPDSLLSLTVESLANGAIPDVYLMGPTGQILATAAFFEGSSEKHATGVFIQEGGLHLVVVSLPQAESQSAYRITARVANAFQSALPVEEQAITVKEVFATEKTNAQTAVQLRILDEITPRIFPSQNDFASARTTELATLLRGEIEPGAEYELWKLNGVQGQMLSLSTMALDGNNTPDISLLDANARIVAEQSQSDNTANSLTYRLPASGTYFVVVRLEHGGRYTLWIESLVNVDETLPRLDIGRVIDYGDTIQGEVETTKRDDRFVFYGGAGDVVTATLNMTVGELLPTVELVDREGEILRSTLAENATRYGTLASLDLPYSGIYKLMVRAHPNDTGITQYKLHLGAQKIITRAENISTHLESQHFGTLSVANPVHHWLFDSFAGESVTIRIEPLAPGTPSPFEVTMTDTEGNAFLRKGSPLGSGAVAFENVMLPRTGVYQVIVTGGGRARGSYRISITRDESYVGYAEGALRYGETVGKVLTRDNFLDVWTFAGSRGDVVSITGRAVRGDTVFLNMQLRTHTGQVLATTASDNLSGSNHIERIVLPLDGHYSVIVGNPVGDFDGAAAYELTVHLEDSVARSMGSKITYGALVEGVLYNDDPQDVWLFEGKQADTATVLLESLSSAVNPMVSLVSTDWYVAATEGLPDVLATVQALAGKPGVLEFQLPFDGTYALYIEDPEGTGGRYSLNLERRNARLTRTRTLSTELPSEGEIGQNQIAEQWTFDGIAKHRVTLTVTPGSRADLAPVIEVMDSSRQLLARVEGAPSAETQLVLPRLPATGQYFVRITRMLGLGGLTSGRFSVRMEMEAPVLPNAPTLNYNQVEPSTLNDEHPTEWWQFSGVQRDVVRIRVETTNGSLDPALRLFDSDGNLLAENDDKDELNAELTVALPSDGGFLIEVRRYGEESGTTRGSYAIVVERVFEFAPLPEANMIRYGERVAGTTDNVRRIEKWMFAGERGDDIHAIIQFSLDDAPLTLVLLDQAGNELAVGERVMGDARIQSYALPTRGFYVLEVRRPADARSAYNPFTLDLTLAGVEHVLPSQGGILTVGSNVTGEFRNASINHLWAFEAENGDKIQMNIHRLSGPLTVNLGLIAPDGSLLMSGSTQAGGLPTFSSYPVSLPLDGIYLIVLSPQNSGLSGSSYRLSVRRVVATPEEPQVLTATRDGLSTIDALSPSDEWQFEANAGDVVSIRASALTGNLSPELIVWKADGIPLAEGVAEQVGLTRQVSIKQLVIPTTGTYNLTVAREGLEAGETAGSYRVMLRRDSISAQAAIAIDVPFNQAVHNFLSSGDTQYFAFQGLAGDSIGILVKGTNSVPLELTLETEAGTPIQVEANVFADETYIPAWVLPNDGRLVVKVTGSEAAFYDLIAFRRSPTAPENGTVRVLGRGQTLAEGILSPDQLNQWNFTGAIGEVFTFKVDTTGSRLRADLALYGPMGYLTSATQYPDSQNAIIGPVRLPADGNYTLIVSPWPGESRNMTGSYTIRADQVGDGRSGSEGGYIADKNLTVFGGLTVEDPQDTWTFEGDANEEIAIQLQQVSGDGVVSLHLSNAAGDWEVSGNASTAYFGAEISQTVLPMGGTYNVQVSSLIPEGTTVEYRLTVYQTSSPVMTSMRTAQGIQYGQELSGQLGETANNGQAWTFYGKTGEAISCVVVPITPDYTPMLDLIDPNGNVLHHVQGWLEGSSLEMNDIQLVQDGFYGLVVSQKKDSQLSAAEYMIRLDRSNVRVLPQGALSSESITRELTYAAPIHSWTLEPSFSGLYRVAVTTLTPGASFGVVVQSADGTPLPSEVAEQSLPGTSSSIIRLQEGQRYTAVVSYGVTMQHGHYAIQLTPASIALDGGQLTLGQEDLGVITPFDFTDTWFLSEAEGNSIRVSVHRVKGDTPLRVVVYDGIESVVADQSNAEDDSVSLVLPPAQGEYRLLVSRQNGALQQTEGTYTILATPEN